ncbi:hypothetical protein ARMSODRAFT_861154, partial [Armillaria solidipes]
ACKLMTQMVNVLGAKTEIGSPMICSYLLGFPDHYTNKTFATFYWKSFVVEAASKWNTLDGPNEKVKVSLKNKKGTIVGVSPVEDYIHRPVELEGLSLYDWIYMLQNMNTRVPYISHDTDDEDSTAARKNAPTLAPSKGKGRRSKFKRLQFVDRHPLCLSHHVKVVPDAERKVPNFVGGMLPHKDKGDREYYCLAM